MQVNGSNIIPLPAVESIWRVRVTEQALLAMCKGVAEQALLAMCNGENMNYSNMIKTEETDSRYEDWKEYRQELTEYISDALEKNVKKNSWVAIWGAGGCNDIEIKELAKSYKLLLIDQDLEKLIKVRESLGLDHENCKVADVGFWSIDDEVYKMFEALLLDGASGDEIERYIRDVVEHVPDAINLEKYSVDCSVLVGLTSQLNARFAALLYMHRQRLSHEDMERLLKIISEMNALATKRLYISMRQITRGVVITGYETKGCYTLNEAQTECQELMSLFEVGVDGGYYLSGNEMGYIKVAGNECWHNIIYKTIIMDKLEDLGRCMVLCWPFLEEKYYPMLMVTLGVNS